MIGWYLLFVVLMMNRVFYAHAKVLYNTQQEQDDLNTLSKHFSVVNPNTQYNQSMYKQRGMVWSKTLMSDVDAVVYRANVDGSIGAGIIE